MTHPTRVAILLAAGLLAPACSYKSDFDDTPYVTGHRWWAKKPTRGQVDQMAQAITDANSGWVVWISDQGKIDSNLAAGRFVAQPPSMGGRPSLHFSIDPDVYSKRLMRPEAIALIRAELDRCDLRDGPASKHQRGESFNEMMTRERKRIDGEIEEQIPKQNEEAEGRRQTGGLGVPLVEEGRQKN